MEHTVKISGQPSGLARHELVVRASLFELHHGSNQNGLCPGLFQRTIDISSISNRFETPSSSPASLLFFFAPFFTREEGDDVPFVFLPLRYLGEDWPYNNLGGTFWKAGKSSQVLPSFSAKKRYSQVKQKQKAKHCVRQDATTCPTIRFLLISRFSQDGSRDDVFFCYPFSSP